eukprot:CAMPEP_0167751398 /NCGR_PEP_ID=MMETSP0110_2-20121227/6548_1 /TAXON_ID=629695 /ORGANISM="Gymnochlora sp., Strain CCMP2014" /LENGTH=397 /DNA_ID=CAMNT_0007636873 /DNA_START=174 /DNA_END=1365 /DNA_ORIENTATION=-
MALKSELARRANLKPRESVSQTVLENVEMHSESETRGVEVTTVPPTSPVTSPVLENKKLCSDDENGMKSDAMKKRARPVDLSEFLSSDASSSEQENSESQSTRSSSGRDPNRRSSRNQTLKLESIRKSLIRNSDDQEDLTLVRKRQSLTLKAHRKASIPEAQGIKYGVEPFVVSQHRHKTEDVLPLDQTNYVQYGIESSCDSRATSTKAYYIWWKYHRPPTFVYSSYVELRRKAVNRKDNESTATSGPSLPAASTMSDRKSSRRSNTSKLFDRFFRSSPVSSSQASLANSRSSILAKFTSKGNETAGDDSTRTKKSVSVYANVLRSAIARNEKNIRKLQKERQRERGRRRAELERWQKRGCVNLYRMSDLLHCITTMELTAQLQVIFASSKVLEKEL